MNDSLSAFLGAQLADPESQWSFGTFGAIAEFARDADEPVELKPGDASLTAVTPRGGIRIDLRPDVRPVAFETTTKDSWNHRVALCLPEDRSAMNQREVLTELGRDGGALNELDRHTVLFDLGFGVRHIDCCVRVSDRDVAAQLRTHCGQPIFGSPAVGIILAASPHRVFLSRLGRLEVFQPIPPPHGRSPDGPHTHVLPGLLRHRRTHAATEPIPKALVPCAYVYPAHPANDGIGHGRPFDRVRHDAFQTILRSYGDPKFVALKQQVRSAVLAGADPSVVAGAVQRFARTNIRVTLRQLKAQQESAPSLHVWMTTYERYRKKH
jgi:hypothetical protein